MAARPYQGGRCQRHADAHCPRALPRGLPRWSHGLSRRGWGAPPGQRGSRRPRLGHGCPKSRSAPCVADGPLLPWGRDRWPAVCCVPDRGPRHVARRYPTGPGLLDRVPPAHLHGRRGRRARDAERLFAPRGAPGIAPYVRRPAAGVLACLGPHSRGRRRRRSPTAPGRPRLIPWVGAAAERGREGGEWGFSGEIFGAFGHLVWQHGHTKAIWT